MSLFSFIFVRTALLNKQPKNFNSAFVDKLKLLHESKFQRKIVLIGGSSVGFGLSAELIEKEIGVKCINLGHHAGFGLMDFQKYVLSNINKNDIIVFSPECEFFSNPTYFDTATLDNLITNNFEYGRLIGNRSHMIKSFFLKLVFFPKEMAVARDNPYVYRCLNKNGDIISHCNPE